MEFTAADSVTLGNLIFGVLAIYLIDKNVYLGSILLLFGVLFDFLDGTIARLTRSSKLGEMLDSLSDLVTFGVAPALIILHFSNTIYTMALSLLFVSCGAYRLARFNSLKNDKKNGYIGMVITANGIVVPLLVYIRMPLLMNLWLLISSILMVSKLDFYKMIDKLRVRQK